VEGAGADQMGFVEFLDLPEGEGVGAVEVADDAIYFFVFDGGGFGVGVRDAGDAGGVSVSLSRAQRPECGWMGRLQTRGQAGSTQGARRVRLVLSVVVGQGSRQLSVWVSQGVSSVQRAGWGAFGAGAGFDGGAGASAFAIADANADSDVGADADAEADADAANDSAGDAVVDTDVDPDAALDNDPATSADSPSRELSSRERTFDPTIEVRTDQLGVDTSGWDDTTFGPISFEVYRGAGGISLKITRPGPARNTLPLGLYPKELGRVGPCRGQRRMDWVPCESSSGGP